MPETKRVRVHISGYGFSEANNASLMVEADRLSALGYDVANSHLPPGLQNREDRLRWSLQVLLSSDLVVQMPGWEISSTARLETSIAASMRMPVLPADFVTDGDVLGKLATARELAKARNSAMPSRPMKPKRKP